MASQTGNTLITPLMPSYHLITRLLYPCETLVVPLLYHYYTPFYNYDILMIPLLPSYYTLITSGSIPTLRLASQTGNTLIAFLLYPCFNFVRPLVPFYHPLITPTLMIPLLPSYYTLITSGLYLALPSYSMVGT
jgi:hypothetical protein